MMSTRFILLRNEATGYTHFRRFAGHREGGGPKLSVAYLRDPGRNKLCALHRM